MNNNHHIAQNTLYTAKTIFPHSRRYKQIRRMSFFLSFVLVGFVAPTIRPLGFIPFDMIRWILLLFLTVYILKLKIIYLSINSHAVSKIGLLFCLWGLSTTLWSSVPQLTFAKAVMLLIIFVTCLASSYMIMRLMQLESSLDYFLPVVVISLVAAMPGLSSESSAIGPLELYRGAMLGPNRLGINLAMCIPFLFWKTNCARYSQKGLKVQYWWALLAGAIILVLITRSRAALVVVLCILLGGLMCMQTNTKVKFVNMGLMFVLLVLALHPGGFEKFTKNYIYKYAQGTNFSQKVLSSRELPWSKSEAAAGRGGLLGVGLGVSYGDYDFQLKSKAALYGREKGNSQLAIIEETGIVGAIIYGTFIMVLSVMLIKMWRRAWELQRRILSGVLTGAIVGMLFHSSFEAWWTAPGSPETVFFWLLVGAAAGLSDRCKYERRMLATQRFKKGN